MELRTSGRGRFCKALSGIEKTKLDRGQRILGSIWSERDGHSGWQTFEDKGRFISLDYRKYQKIQLKLINLI